MVRVEASTRIDRPAEEVWSYIDDLTRMPEWIHIISETVASESPTRVGTRIDNHVRLLGRTFHNELEVVEHVPNHKVVSRGVKPFPLTVTYTVEPVDGNGSSTFTTVLEAEPVAFFRLGEPILTRVGRHRFQGHLRNLKALLEKGNAA